MMGMLGLIARQQGMARLMLTVIDANVAAVRFSLCNSQGSL